MKKIGLIILLSLISTISTVNAVTVGGLGIFDPGGFSATASSGLVEVELSITALSSSTLSLSADYTLISGGIIDNLSWNFAVGAGVNFNSAGLGLNIIAPVELVYKIREILNGLDIYLQAKPIIPLYPTPSFEFEIGLGVRVGL